MGAIMDSWCCVPARAGGKAMIATRCLGDRLRFRVVAGARSNSDRYTQAGGVRSGERKETRERMRIWLVSQRTSEWSVARRPRCFSLAAPRLARA